MAKEKEQKEGIVEPPKRRKTLKTVQPENTDTTNSGPKQTVVAADLYLQTITQEEKEAKERNADEDANLFYKTCSEIMKILHEISSLKNEKGTLDTIRQREVEIACKILYLKKLNRLEKFRMKESRAELQKYREQVDNDHLQLQNLVYETQHLSNEVNKCLEFKSIDEELDLIPIEEFYATAPEDVSKPEVTKSNEHELRLARLTWELMKRKELSAQVKKMEEEKESISKNIDARTDQLNKLEPLLSTMLEATKPLQDILNIPIDKTKKLHELAHQLPVPLYVLFVQADGFTRSVKWLKTDIIGDTESVTADRHFDEISSESDSDTERETSRRRKSVKIDRKRADKSAEQLQKECLKLHPLTVVLKIQLTKGATITLEFQWLTTLEMAAVVPNVTFSSQQSESDGIASCSDILAPNTLLTELFPGDTGEQYPNAGAFYHLNRAGLEAIPSFTAGLGIPYNWVQTLCGVNHLQASFECKVELCQNNIETTLLAIRNRVKSRMALAKEIAQFDVGNQLVNRKMKSLLTSFSPSTFMDFERVCSARPLIEAGVITTSQLFYKTTILSNAVKLIAHIVVHPNYPKTAPLFLIEVHYKESFSSATSNHIRDLEREINVFCCDDVEGSTDLLLRQMQHLLLSTESLVSGEYEQQQQNIRCPNFKPILGRSRSYPYKFIDTAGGLYLHR